MRLAPLLLLTATLALVAGPRSASAVTLLTRGAVVALDGTRAPERWRGVVRVGRDPALADAPSPACPTVTTFELGLFTVATNGVERNARVTLDCAAWRATKRGWTYVDPALPGGIRRILYGPRGLVVKLTGPAVLPAAGPVGYVQAWFAVDAARFHVRVHEFRRNRSDLVVSRRRAARAARAEAAFWAHLWGDEATLDEEETLDALAAAARRSKRDGRSRFLLGMLHLYRFGRMTVRVADADAAARAEIAAAAAALGEAEALLWDRATREGDSRVPGFAAAARYALGVVDDDDALLARARDDLAYAIEINAFFNVFDLMTITQAEPPDSPVFIDAFNAMDAYLSDPDTLICALTQPEVCTNAGLAPTALQGTFVLFGDLYAKAGDADEARRWYQFGSGVDTGWRFAGIYAERLATVDARVAAYQDEDPTNDPPIVGSGEQACASCHNRPTPTP